MIRFGLAAILVVAFAGTAAAEAADVNCRIVKTYRCNAQACEPVAIDVGLMFNLGSMKACLSKGGACVQNLTVQSSERIGNDVIVRFAGNGMTIRVNAQNGNMVGGDASEHDTVYAYGGTCQ